MRPRIASTVWIDDRCDGCGAVDVFGVLLGTTALCLDCVLCLADAAARHPGGRPDATARALRGHAAPGLTVDNVASFIEQWQGPADSRDIARKLLAALGITPGKP